MRGSGEDGRPVEGYGRSVDRHDQRYLRRSGAIRKGVQPQGLFSLQVTSRTSEASPSGDDRPAGGSGRVGPAFPVSNGDYRQDRQRHRVSYRAMGPRSFAAPKKESRVGHGHVTNGQDRPRGAALGRASDRGDRRNHNGRVPTRRRDGGRRNRGVWELAQGTVRRGAQGEPSARRASYVAKRHSPRVYHASPRGFRRVSQRHQRRRVRERIRRRVEGTALRGVPVPWCKFAVFRFVRTDSLGSDRHVIFSSVSSVAFTVHSSLTGDSSLLGMPLLVTISGSTFSTSDEKVSASDTSGSLHSLGIDFFFYAFSEHSIFSAIKTVLTYHTTSISFSG